MNRDAMPDQKIVSSAADALRRVDGLPGDALTVAVDGDWITVSGTVDWQHQRKAAIQALRSLTGVRGISDRILVRSNPFTIALEPRVDAQCLTERNDHET